MSGLAPTMAPSGHHIHDIRWGDTLSQIARDNGTTVDKLMELNPYIKDRDLIYTGRTLIVPGEERIANSIVQPHPQHVSYTSPGGDPYWMDIANGTMGVREISGGSNPAIEEYHATTSFGRASDDVPWCSSWMNWVMEEAGMSGTDSAAAVSWVDWEGGRDVGSLGQAEYGDIVVIRFNNGQHHVGFLVGADDGSITLRGGNQGDQVKDSTYSLSSLDILAIKRPGGVPGRGDLIDI